MAWPNSPLTTYNFDAPPSIKAADLNAFQDAINQIINGSYSLKAVTVDGVGGNSVTTGAGNVIISGTLFVPTISSQAAVYASGNQTFDGTGSVTSSSTYQCTGNSTGPSSSISVVFTNPLSNTNYKVLTTTENNGGQSYTLVVTTKATTGFRIEFRNPIGNTLQLLINTGISFIVTT